MKGEFLIKLTATQSSTRPLSHPCTHTPLHIEQMLFNKLPLVHLLTLALNPLKLTSTATHWTYHSILPLTLALILSSQAQLHKLPLVLPLTLALIISSQAQLHKLPLVLPLTLVYSSSHHKHSPTQASTRLPLTLALILSSQAQLQEE